MRSKHIDIKNQFESKDKYTECIFFSMTFFRETFSIVFNNCTSFLVSKLLKLMLNNQAKKNQLIQQNTVYISSMDCFHLYFICEWYYSRFYCLAFDNVEIEVESKLLRIPFTCRSYSWIGYCVTCDNNISCSMIHSGITNIILYIYYQWYLYMLACAYNIHCESLYINYKSSIKSLWVRWDIFSTDNKEMASYFRFEWMLEKNNNL